MSSLTVETITTENHADEVERQIAEALHAAMREAAEAGAVVARNAAPVRTGALRDSITVVVDSDDTVGLGAGVEYAIFIELGTVHEHAQPFIAPGMQETYRVLKSKTGAQ